MKMFNRKPCMKCGGKVKYKNGGKLRLPIMFGGGTPPNCDPGYMVDPNDATKCIPAQTISSSAQNTSQIIPLFPIPGTSNASNNLYGISGISSYGPAPLTTTTTINPNVPPGIPNNMQNTGVPSGINIWQTENKPISFNNTGNGFNPFNVKMDPKQTGPEQKIGVEQYVLNQSTTTTTTIPKVNFPGNVKLEIANSFVNAISRAVASNRNFNEYFDRQNFFRTPINDWATNEQKGVPGYNTYFKSGGELIKANMGLSITTQSTRPPRGPKLNCGPGGCVEKFTQAWNSPGKINYAKVRRRDMREVPEFESLQGWLSDEEIEKYQNDPSSIFTYAAAKRIQNMRDPKNNWVRTDGTYAGNKGSAENFFNLMGQLERSGIYDPNDLSKLQMWAASQGNIKDRINKDYYSYLSIPNPPKNYTNQELNTMMQNFQRNASNFPGYNFQNYKKGGSINNNKNNNMIKIKKENRGKFTAQARRAGMGVQEFADYVLGNRGKFSDATVKRANFARNAAGWKKEFGGTTMYNPYYDQLYMMQDGGAMPMEGGMEGQAGGEDQMQQIIMMIVEALREGMAPEEIIQALVQMGIPQEQAVQILQAVVEQLQQGGGEGQMQGAPMEGQQQQAMAQQAAPPMRRGGYKMQEGGSMDDQTNMIIESYSQLKGISPEQLMQQISQQLQSVPPAQRNQTLQTILKGFAAEIQQAQQGAEAGQMQQEQGMMRLGGMHSNYYR